MTHRVFFEIYGKKLQVEVDAESKEEAKEIVRDSILFRKITIEDRDAFADDMVKKAFNSDKTLNDLREMFGMKD